MNIYQYANGDYLPVSSQPVDTESFEIKTKEYTPHESVRYMNVFVGKNGIALRRTSDGEFKETDKQLPLLYENRENCCGCTACFAICPVQAICMNPDEEGFLYPVVDAEKCIRCYKCLPVCAFKDMQKKKGFLK